MNPDDIVRAMLEDALQKAKEGPQEVSTPETRAAYARGVRAMAGLVNACVTVVDAYAHEYRDHPVAGVMFNGYALALRHILKSADDLIPPGYEQ